MLETDVYRVPKGTGYILDHHGGLVRHCLQSTILSSAATEILAEEGAKHPLAGGSKEEVLAPTHNNNR